MSAVPEPPRPTDGSRPTLRRRGFLAGASVAALSVPYVGFKLVFGSPEDIVVAVLRRRLSHLRIDQNSLAPFAAAYVAFKAQHEARLKLLSVIALPYRFVSLYGLFPTGHPMRRLEDSMVSKYLLSTDFFEHGADEARLLRYVAFYDSATTPCRNYVARPLGRMAPTAPLSKQGS